ncbi:MAG: transcription termination/antitermination NusG family protein [Desulforegulaceae bacterium]|nr:transcription termination/antitermination NusG family protein [Desulforegulaceae bacterium]
MLSINYSEFNNLNSNCSFISNDCSHWYVVQTLAGQEKKLAAMANFLSEQKFNIYIPAREVIHKIKGEEFVVNLPIFPGYIFIYKHIDDFIKKINDSTLNIFAKPVQANGKYLEVSPKEMKFLFDIAGNDGVISISRVIILKDQKVKIVKGPLKNFEGKILFINKRKNKAKVRMEIMNRIVEVSLGFEILEI